MIVKKYKGYLLFNSCEQMKCPQYVTFARCVKFKFIRDHGIQIQQLDYTEPKT